MKYEVNTFPGLCYSKNSDAQPHDSSVGVEKLAGAGGVPQRGAHPLPHLAPLGRGTRRELGRHPIVPVNGINCFLANIRS